MKKIVYISDNAKPKHFLDYCLKSLSENATRTGCELIAVTEKPVSFGKNILMSHFNQDGGIKMIGIFLAYIVGLSFCSDTDEVFFSDDDALYPDEHFLLPFPELGCRYNLELIFLGESGFFDKHNRCSVNNACIFGKAKFLRQYYAWKLDEVARGDWNGGFEPTSSGVRPYVSSCIRSKIPVIDIRIHSRTWRQDKSDKNYTTFDGWGEAAGLLKYLKGEVSL